MSSLLRAPRVRLSWPAGSLTIYYYSTRIFRRPARMPVQPWTLIAEFKVPSGYTATNVEAQHTRFDDYMAGWYSSGGEWASGWDYVVTQVDIAGNEAQIAPASITATRITVTDPGNVWWATNHLPPLNCPIEIAEPTASEIDPGISSRRYAGRPKWVNVSRVELPGRSLSSSASFFAPVGPDELRCLRYAMKSGLQFAMLRPLGDRIIGNPYVSGFADVPDAEQTVSIGMLETVEDSVAQYNLPAGLVLNGSSQYLTTPDATQLDPASSAFSVVMAAKFSSTASKYALSKGNLGTADGYGLRTTANANELQFFIDGATTSGGPVATSADWFSDVSVAVGTSSGTAQVLYRNGVVVGNSAVTHGAVANAIALVAGANNGGASAFSALAPLQSFAVYMRTLTATEARDASYHLLGYPGFRMPPGATIYVDLRDDRTWNGATSVLKDLSGWGNTVTAVGSPTTRGIPWKLEDYETL